MVRVARGGAESLEHLADGDPVNADALPVREIIVGAGEEHVPETARE